MSELKRFDSVDRWVKRLRPSTAESNLYVLRCWVAWLGERGFEVDVDRLVEMQRSRGGYEILDLAQEYVLGIEGRESYKRRCYATLRSLFMHNRAELPRDPVFKVHSDIPRVVGSLSVEDFRSILSSCNPMYRAIYLCMFQGTMGIGEFEYWNRNGFKETTEQLERGKNPLKVNFPGRKRARNIRPYHSFIGRDGISMLKEYLEDRPKYREIRDQEGRVVKREKVPEAIFINQYYNPVTGRNAQIYWMRRLIRLNLIKKLENHNTGNRYGKNIHELRDLFRSRWQKTGRAAEVAEFMMGHIVDPLEYNKAFRDDSYTRREYRQAEPWLNILSGDPEVVPRDEIVASDMKWEKRFEEYEEKIRRLEELILERA